MRFVKHNFFRIGDRRFRVLTGMVHLKGIDDYENQVGNAVEFEEVAKDKDFTEIIWRDTGNVETKLKSELYALLEENKLTIE